MFSSSDIHTLTEFNRKSSRYTERLLTTKRPELLTVNGKAALVVQEVKSYERLVELADYAESLINIRKALEETGRPLSDFMADFERRQGVERKHFE